jgi:hypothetical protein
MHRHALFDSLLNSGLRSTSPSCRSYSVSNVNNAKLSLQGTIDAGKAMRWLAQITVILLSLSIANANTLTSSDVGAALAINRALLTAIKDVNQARRGMMQGNDFSANSVCVEQIQTYLIVIQTSVQSLVQLFLIASQMTDARDEATSLHITGIAVDEFLTDIPPIRAEMNRLSGLCSRFPLPVAKALQSVELIDRAIALSNSVSRRLKTVGSGQQ